MKTLQLLGRAALCFLLLSAPAFAQNPGAVTDHGFAIGQGPGKTGFRSALCSSGQLPIGQPSADPLCRTIGADVTLDNSGNVLIGAGKVDNSRLATMPANTMKGSLNGTTTSDITLVACNTAYQVTKWISGTGWQCGAAPIINSRTQAQSLDLSAYQTIRTLSYNAPGDTGGATFVNVGSATFLDSFVNGGGTITNAGAGCVNGTYKGVYLTGGTGRQLAATVIVSGGVVTAVNLVNQGGGYTVGDSLTSTTPGCTTAFAWQVSSVTVPLASFTDSAGNHWQYTPDPFIHVKQFGAKFDCFSGANCDATATDDYPPINNALIFANVGCSNTGGLGADTGRCNSSKVLLPYGTAKVCVGSTTFATLVVPTSVVLEGMNQFGSILKQCDSDPAFVNFVSLGNPNLQLACFGPGLRDLELFPANASANVGTAMIYTNCAQQSREIQNVAVYAGRRMCHLAETGYGGAANYSIDNFFCVGLSISTQPYLIRVNYNAMISLKDIIGESGAGSSSRLILVEAGLKFTIDGAYMENLAGLIDYNDTTTGAVLTVIGGVVGLNASTCTDAAVRRIAGSLSGRTNLIGIRRGSCTNATNNAGTVSASDVLTWTTF